MATPKKVTKVVTNQSFRDQVLSEITKSPEEKQIEQVDDKIEDFSLAIEAEIRDLEDEIKVAEKDLKRSDRDVINAEKELYKVKRAILGKSFDSYIQGINSAKSAIKAAKDKQNTFKSKIENQTKVLEQYKELQEMFK